MCIGYTVSNYKTITNQELGRTWMGEVVVCFTYYTNISWLEFDGHKIRKPVVSTLISSYIRRHYADLTVLIINPYEM
jgi:hypothetical protein